MDDNDNDPTITPLHNDPRFLLATTIATLVIAGSAYVWRSNTALLHSHHWGERAITDPDSTVTADTISAAPASSTAEASLREQASANAANHDLGTQDAKDLKNSRPKERRRRGKDPFKEILKSGKKDKPLPKSSRIGNLDDHGLGPSIATQGRDSTRFSHSRDASLATSSGSVSTSSTSNRREPMPQHSDWASSQGDENEDAPPSLTPTATMTFPSTSKNPSFTLETSDSCASGIPSPSRVSDSPLQPQTPDFPSISLSTSSSTSHSSSNFSSDSGITPNTSPTLSLSGKTPTLAQSESSPLPASKPVPNSQSPSSIRQTQKYPGPWDWDGVGPTPASDSTYHRPPRFRSKSRGSGSTPLSPPLPPSISSAAYPSESQSGVRSPSSSSPAVSPRSAESHDDASVPFTFPTLNASSGPLSGPSISPAPNRNANPTSNSTNGNGFGTGNTPKRVPTPRRSTPPGTGTPPPSLNTQTQLASLRGALEAARVREERTKSDIERYAKDLDMMRWENVAARRREVELQGQVHHLLHQLQTYASAFATVSGQPSPLSPHHNAPTNPSTNGTSSQTQNGYQFSPSTSGSHHSPPHLQIPSPAQVLLANGLISPIGMLSPMSMTHSGPHSPFYPYAPHSPHSHQHSHPHVLPQPTQSPQHQSNLYSMLFPHTAGTTTTATGSGPSSVAGSSSVGSHSPDLAGSPTPSPALLDRERGRTRKSTQSVGSRVGGGSWESGEGGNNGWMDDETDGNGGRRPVDARSDDEEEEMNEVLVDAILKRPGSIRGLSSKKSKIKDKERESQETTEFTFPSLSNFGNLMRSHGASVDVPADESPVTVDEQTGDIIEPRPVVEPLAQLSGLYTQEDPR